MASSFGSTDNRTRQFLRFEGRSLVASHRNAPYRRFQDGYDGGPLESKRTSGSAFLIMSPSQTAARVDIFMIAVLPQTGQRHRNANGEAAAGSQSQRVSVWFIRDALVMGHNVGRTKPRLHLREQRFCAAKVCNRYVSEGSFAPEPSRSARRLGRGLSETGHYPSLQLMMRCAHVCGRLLVGNSCRAKTSTVPQPNIR
jgi:hypothetical protein